MRSSISIVQEFFAGINRVTILVGQLGTILSFDEVLRFFSVVSQLVRQLVSTMFITNDRASFDLEKNLVKQQKV